MIFASHFDVSTCNYKFEMLRRVFKAFTRYAQGTFGQLIAEFFFWNFWKLDDTWVIIFIVKNIKVKKKKMLKLTLNKMFIFLNLK